MVVQFCFCKHKVFAVFTIATACNALIQGAQTGVVLIFYILHP